MNRKTKMPQKSRKTGNKTGSGLSRTSPDKVPVEPSINGDGDAPRLSNNQRKVMERHQRDIKLMCELIKKSKILDFKLFRFRYNMAS